MAIIRQPISYKSFAAFSVLAMSKAMSVYYCGGGLSLHTSPLHRLWEPKITSRGSVSDENMRSGSG